MNRRGFLRLFGMTAAVVAVAPSVTVGPLTSAPKVGYTAYLMGSDAIITDQYADFISMSDIYGYGLAPTVLEMQREMTFRFAASVDAHMLQLK